MQQHDPRTQIAKSDDTQMMQDHRWNDLKPSGLHLQRFSAIIDPETSYNVDFSTAAPLNLSIFAFGRFPVSEVSVSATPLLFNCLTNTLLCSIPVWL